MSMRPTQDALSAERDSGASPYLLWLIWVFWLFFLAQPLSALLAEPSSPRKVFGIVAMTLFTGVYLWLTWQEAWRLSRTAPTRAANDWRSLALFAALLAISVTLIIGGGPSALGSLIYVSASVAGRLTAWRAATAVAGLTLLGVFLGVVTRSPVEATAQIIFIIPSVGAVVYFLSSAIRTNQELRRARQEIARLAVSEERLRFARDLHDLLGHTLSLIALKSELAGRLVEVAPEQASAEIGDIETAARQALAEVREAVAAYRQPTLAVELSGARELLAAAGIALTQEGEARALASAAESALAWAVREGVTNVIRHSRAKNCVIALAQTDNRVTLEVRDDGAAAASAGAGAGLKGLQERLAVLDGSCAAGAAEGGGWRLVVGLPLRAAADSTGASAATDNAPRQQRRMTAWFG